MRETHILETKNVGLYTWRGGGRGSEKVYRLYTHENVDIFGWPLSLILVYGFISSRLGYCTVLLFGLPHCLHQRLQYVQNAAARLIAQKQNHDHVTHIRRALQWLPVKQRINFKECVHAYNAQHNLAPAYISEQITPYKPTRRLRSCDKYHLVEHRTKLYGDQAF